MIKKNEIPIDTEFGLDQTHLNVAITLHRTDWVPPKEGLNITNYVKFTAYTMAWS